MINRWAGFGELEIRDLVLDMLLLNGIWAKKEVVCSRRWHRADIVTDKAVIEFKIDLFGHNLFHAFGQAAAYKNSLQKETAVVVVPSFTSLEESKVACVSEMIGFPYYVLDKWQWSEFFRMVSHVWTGDEILVTPALTKSHSLPIAQLENPSNPIRLMTGGDSDLRYFVEKNFIEVHAVSLKDAKQIRRNHETTIGDLLFQLNLTECRIITPNGEFVKVSAYKKNTPEPTNDLGAKIPEFRNF